MALLPAIDLGILVITLLLSTVTVEVAPVGNAAAVNEEGLLLDDVRVEALNYQSDFEADDGGWVAAGFVRVQNALPQTYRLSLILRGDTTTVTPVELNSDNTAEIPFSLQSGDEAILIVTGTTRFTTIPAAYQIEIK